MKSVMADTYLVIHVRNANALIVKCGPISRWFMNQSQTMFGSPVRSGLSGSSASKAGYGRERMRC